MNSDFYTMSILPHAGIIIKICKAYTNTQDDFEDYYQEVCFQIWKSHEKFSGKSQWSTWIYKLTLNVCLTLLKKARNAPHGFASDFIPEVPIEDRCSFADDELNKLYQAIRQLSEVDRGVILLYLEEQSYQDIADIFETTANNIGVRIKRIKQRLRKLLDE
ncbi:MAG: RNA polymerase [Gammaproteobacteria bacterium]|nr:MAG: RNA polymerase [Gammaproteobacteria bacterium]